ncbi:MAG: hypothetical protein ACLFV7_08725 [Phycisphaerae bacterium]
MLRSIVSGCLISVSVCCLLGGCSDPALSGPGPTPHGPAREMLSEITDAAYTNLLGEMGDPNFGDGSQAVMKTMAAEMEKRLEGKADLLRQHARWKLQKLPRRELNSDDYRVVLEKTDIIDEMKEDIEEGDKKQTRVFLWDPLQVAAQFRMMLVARQLSVEDVGRMAMINNVSYQRPSAVDASPEAPVIAWFVGPDVTVCHLTYDQKLNAYLPTKVRWLREKSFPTSWPEK